MNLSAGVSVLQLLISMGVLLVASGIAWGSLLQRVKMLETQIDTLSKAFPAVSDRLARIEEKVSNTDGNLNRLLSSWLFREPPSYEYEPRATKPRRD